MKLHRKPLLVITAIICVTISLFTPTEYYFSGLYTYSWGYIAKGNIAFNIFGAFGMIVIAYLAFEGFKKLRTETNYIMRIKIKYIVFSLLASATLTLGNIPAINGIDFYPLGNLNFIPLAILAYGVLRFRLMDIRSIIHITVVWGVVSSLVIIPNTFVLIYFWPSITRLGMNQLVLIALCWFAVNYLYMLKVQPFINQLFNKRKYNLQLVESQFIENIAHLKSYEDLVREFTDILRKTLSFTDFYIMRRNEESGNYVLKSGEFLNLSDYIQSLFLKNNDLMNKSLVETDPLYSPVRNELLGIFSRLNCEFILPFIHNEKIIVILTMPERANPKQLTLDEMHFVNNLKNAVLIALLNSMMYLDITNYKNNLELMVTERTGQLRQSEEKYRTILENIEDGYYEVDFDGNFTFFNDSMCLLFGYSQEEMMGMNNRQYTDKENAKKLFQAFNKVYKTGNSTNEFTLQIIRKDGTKRFLESSISLQKDSSGKPSGFRGVTRDATERKQAEEALQKAHDDLESQVTLRTAELSKANELLQADIVEREKAEEELKQTLESLRKSVGATIQVMVSAVEMRDPYTAGHQIRTADLARTIATEMGLPKEKIDGIRMAGSIHDIGKLSIPAEILTKPTKLTDIEFSLIKEHSHSGYEMLKDVESPWPLAQIVYQHHERMDGSGYPRNLKGDEILIEARIMAVADVVEAMASHRPYRPGLGIDAALAEIEKNKGTHYDNTVADACLKLFREKGYQLK
jgi:PAS domain S-box-containing protein